MKVSKNFEDVGYTLLFIATIVVIYVVQHECVKYGFDAAVSAYDTVVEWGRAL